MGSEPLQSAPGLIALVVGLIVWYRHRADRRARVFLALAATELAFGLQFFIAATALPQHRVGVAAVNGFVLALGLVSATIFLHFGMSFPHARPWLRRGNIKVLYLASVIIGITPVAAAVIGPGAQARIQDALDGTLVGVGVLVLIASTVACVSIYRSYREMTADERRTFRAPVMGVMIGMIAGMAVDIILAILFSFASAAEHRSAVLISNLLATAAALLLPLFFFMAASKYKLLERHGQDYIAKL